MTRPLTDAECSASPRVYDMAIRDALNWYLRETDALCRLPYSREKVRRMRALADWKCRLNNRIMDV